MIDWQQQQLPPPCIGAQIALSWGMENLYNYDKAAETLGLAGRSSIRSRMKALASRGKPLTVEAGDLYQIGARRLITDQGLIKLRDFEPLPAGRPIGAVNKFAHETV